MSEGEIALRGGGGEPAARRSRSGANGHAAERGNLSCTSCGLCCTYVSMEIEPPHTVDDAATMLWYLYHPGLSLYTSEGEWVLQMDSRCKFLQPDNRCAIYETRPPICRSFDETDCEVNARDVGISFYDPQTFLAYLAREHKRVHTALSKRFVPPDAMLAAGPADPRRLAPFAPRVRALRALAHG